MTHYLLGLFLCEPSTTKAIKEENEKLKRPNNLFGGKIDVGVLGVNMFKEDEEEDHAMINYESETAHPQTVVRESVGTDIPLYEPIW